MSSIRPHVSWLILGAAGFAAAAFVFPLSDQSTEIDRALPWIALVVCAAGWMARNTAWALPGALCLPVLMLGAVFAPDEKLRSLIYGTAFALSISFAVASRVRQSLKASEGLLLLLLIAVPFRLFGSEPPSAIVAAFIIAGCAALLIARTSWSMFAVSVAVALATPTEPSRAGVFPWMLAALSAPVAPFVRPALILPLAVVGGRWAWPFVAAALVLALLERRAQRPDPEARRSVALPMYAFPLSLTASLRPLFVFADLFSRIDRGTVIGAALLLGGAFLRPSLALLYALAGVAVAATTEKRDGLPATPAVFGVAMLALLPWSGALIATFPLPVQTAVVAAVAGCGLLISVRGSDLLRVMAGLALIALIAHLRMAAASAWEPAVAVLSPGQSATFTVPQRGRAVELAMSGGNVAALARRSTLGTIDLIDTRGNAYRRKLSVGDVSDWNALSRGELWRNQNGLPSIPVGPVEGHGANAFLNGAGIVRAEIPGELATIRITAAPGLHSTARLHVDAMRTTAR